MGQQSENSSVDSNHGREYWATFMLKTRPIWSVLILIVVGVVSAIIYPTSNLGNYYATAAQVIVTLYVAMAVGGLIGVGQTARKLTREHWVFLIVSSAGLLASLRGLSLNGKNTQWLTGLTVAGITATVLLVAENLVNWAAGKAVVLWAPLFIAITVVLVLAP